MHSIGYLGVQGKEVYMYIDRANRSTHKIPMKDVVEVKVCRHARKLHQVAQVPPGIRTVHNPFLVALHSIFKTFTSDQVKNAT